MSEMDFCSFQNLFNWWKCRECEEELKCKGNLKKHQYIMKLRKLPRFLLLVWTLIQSAKQISKPQENAKKAHQLNCEKCQIESKVQVTIQKHL